MQTYRIRHLTRYRYRQLVAFGEHRLALRPRQDPDQHLLDFSAAIRPLPTSLVWSQDEFGNTAGLARFAGRATELHVETTSLVAIDDRASRRHGLVEVRASGLAPGLDTFMAPHGGTASEAVAAWAAEVAAEDPHGGAWSFLSRLSAAIRRDFTYRRRDEAGIQNPDATLRDRRGTCRDFAVLAADAVRSRGFAARFASGYLHVGHVDGAVGGIAHPGLSTHAWLQVYLTGAGWIDVDPTSGTVGNRDLVRVAVVRDPADASPVSGSFLGFPGDFIDMSVRVEVTAVAGAETSGRHEPAAMRA